MGRGGGLDISLLRCVHCCQVEGIVYTPIYLPLSFRSDPQRVEMISKNRIAKEGAKDIDNDAAGVMAVAKRR